MIETKATLKAESLIAAIERTINVHLQSNDKDIVDIQIGYRRNRGAFV